MRKLLLKVTLLLSTALLSVSPAQAAETGMYFNNVYVIRNLETVGDFDMLPILDIAGELGYNCSFDGIYIKLFNDNQSFDFEMGSASVFDKDGKWFGLDVVPQYINGRVMIPANFVTNVLGMSYTWDPVTKSIFINSDYSYNWLINTPEYIAAKNTPKVTTSSSYNNSYSTSSYNNSSVVYITRAGAKYHRSGCSSLRKSKIEINRSSAISRGYTACKNCKP